MGYSWEIRVLPDVSSCEQMIFQTLPVTYLHAYHGLIESFAFLPCRKGKQCCKCSRYCEEWLYLTRKTTRQFCIHFCEMPGLDLWRETRVALDTPRNLLRVQAGKSYGSAEVEWWRRQCLPRMNLPKIFVVSVNQMPATTVPAKICQIHFGNFGQLTLFALQSQSDELNS